MCICVEMLGTWVREYGLAYKGMYCGKYVLPE